MFPKKLQEELQQNIDGILHELAKSDWKIKPERIYKRIAEKISKEFLWRNSI